MRIGSQHAPKIACKNKWLICKWQMYCFLRPVYPLFVYFVGSHYGLFWLVCEKKRVFIYECITWCFPWYTALVKVVSLSGCDIVWMWQYVPYVRTYFKNMFGWYGFETMFTHKVVLLYFLQTCSLVTAAFSYLRKCLVFRAFSVSAAQTSGFRRRQTPYAWMLSQVIVILTHTLSQALIKFYS